MDKDEVFPYHIAPQIPISPSRKLSQRNEMNLPGSSRGLGIELDNPKEGKLKKNYLHGYPFFFFFLPFQDPFTPLFFQEREPRFPMEDAFHVA